MPRALRSRARHDAIPRTLRAFGQRVRARRNNKIATVAVARKLACLAWQLLSREQD